MVPINVGVRFQPLGASEPNIENKALMKHWVLVFSPPFGEFTFTYEAVPGKDDAIHTPIMYYDGALDAYPVGTYHGRWDDLRRVLEVHPQRGTIYSACFNNCQHFVAIYLIFLASHAKYAPGRSWSFDSNSRYRRIASVLNVQTSSGTQLWNRPNIFLAAKNFIPVPVSGAVALSAKAASQIMVPTTVTTIRSASGIAGWLVKPSIVSKTVLVPATYAKFASACIPLAIVGTVITGAAYGYNMWSWKQKTIFRNPWISGFPRGQYSVLTSLETSIPTSVEAHFGFLSSASASVTLAASKVPVVTVVLARNHRAWVHPAIGALGATALYQLSSMVLEMSDVMVMDGYRAKGDK